MQMIKMSPDLKFVKISNDQYQVTDNFKTFFGHLVKNGESDWVYLIDERNIALTIFNIQQIQTKLSELIND